MDTNVQQTTKLLQTKFLYLDKIIIGNLILKTYEI